jgi:hypothetical protein
MIREMATKAHDKILILLMSCIMLIGCASSKYSVQVYPYDSSKQKIKTINGEKTILSKRSGIILTAQRKYSSSDEDIVKVAVQIINKAKDTLYVNLDSFSARFINRNTGGSGPLKIFSAQDMAKKTNSMSFGDILLGTLAILSLQDPSKAQARQNTMDHLDKKDVANKKQIAYFNSVLFSEAWLASSQTEGGEIFIEAPPSSHRTSSDIELSFEAKGKIQKILIQLSKYPPVPVDRSKAIFVKKTKPKPQEVLIAPQLKNNKVESRQVKIEPDAPKTRPEIIQSIPVVTELKPKKVEKKLEPEDVDNNQGEKVDKDSTAKQSRTQRLIGSF